MAFDPTGPDINQGLTPLGPGSVLSPPVLHVCNTLYCGANARHLFLQEVPWTEAFPINPGAIMLHINGAGFRQPITFFPVSGTVEEWTFINQVRISMFLLL